ncbi:hypothetical protein DB42_EA00680 [Neochlamydia sp. EPS4]|nr:hypothetical protein [Neochlamydia sp. S13]KIC76196.1 hypothetical protein DB42_EA00680 [Neochlamydia sp. EPS4]
MLGYLMPSFHFTHPFKRLVSAGFYNQSQLEETGFFKFFASVGISDDDK